MLSLVYDNEVLVVTTGHFLYESVERIKMRRRILRTNKHNI